MHFQAGPKVPIRKVSSDPFMGDIINLVLWEPAIQGKRRKCEQHSDYRSIQRYKVSTQPTP